MFQASRFNLLFMSLLFVTWLSLSVRLTNIDILFAGDEDEEEDEEDELGGGTKRGADEDDEDDEVSLYI